MLRRSFSVLLAFLILGLLIVLGSAMLNSRGVEDSIERARNLLGEHKPGETVQVLNRTQRSLGPSSTRAVRRDLHILRAAAMADSALRNYDKAVEDLDFLLSEFKKKEFDAKDPRGFPFAVDKVEIERRRIRCLLLSEDAEAAIGAARSFLEEHRDDQIVLDLAGQSLQAIYRKKRKSILNEDLDLALSNRRREKLEKALIPWLYTRPEAPSSSRHYNVVVEIMNEALDPLTADKIIEKCLDLRSDIQACASYYSRALRGSKAMPASLQGYTGILLRAGDLDGAAALSWLYLQRFDGLVAAVAARRCMEAHILQGDPGLALLAGRTWMKADEPAKPGGPWQDWNLARAYAYFALVLFRQGQLEDLSSLAQSLRALLESSSRDLRMSLHWSQGLVASLNRNWASCEINLGYFCADPGIFFKPDFGIDLFLIAMRQRVDAALAHKNATLAQKVLKEWIQRRPDSVEARLELVQLMVEKLGLFRRASKECEALLAMPRVKNSHDRAVDLLLQAQDGLLAAKGWNSKSLTQHLIEKRTPIHRDIPHPVLRYGIACFASLLGADAEAIFEANIRQFLEDYPYSSNARSLLAQYYFRKKQYIRAIFETNRILDNDPGHLLAALLMRKALVATKTPLATRLAFDREFISRFSDRPEAAQILGELLLKRGAYEDALLVSNKSLGALSLEKGLPWIRGRAQIALKNYKQALSDLLDLPTTSPHREEALLLALRTALDHDLENRVQGIVQKMLAEKIPTKTMFEAAVLCATKGLQDVVLELLDPIYLGRDEESIKTRNGAFFTLRARSLLAKGRTKEARDMLLRAVSFDDGTKAGAYLVLTALFSGRAEEAQKFMEQLGTLEGPALTLLFLDYKLANFASARKHLKAAKLQGNYVEQVLALALDSVEGKQTAESLESKTSQSTPKKSTPKKSTGVARLDTFARGHAERLLEALCFAPDMAFRARSNEAQASLEAWVSDGEDSVVEGFLVKLVAAWRRELRGARIPARESFGALLRPSTGSPLLQPFFSLTHREFLRLAGDDYIFLTNPHLAQYWASLVVMLGADKLIDLGITQLSLLSAGRMLVNAGKLDLTRKLIETAEVLTKNDLPILEMLAKAREHTGSPDLAIETRLQRYELLTGKEKIQEMKELLRLREVIARAGKLQDAEYAKPIKKLQEVIYVYLESPATPMHPPLGKATLIETAAHWGKDPKTVKELLSLYFTPYMTGKIPPGLDPEGLRDLLDYLLEKGHKQARSWLSGILLQDPSLLGLQLLDARELARRGQKEKAIAALAHFENLLPSERTSLALAGLRARTGLGNLQQKQGLLSRLERLYPNSSEIEQGLLQFRLGDPEASIRLLGSKPVEDLQPVDRLILDLARLYARKVDDYAKIQARMKTRASVRDFQVGEDLAAQLQNMIPQEASPGR